MWGNKMTINNPKYDKQTAIFTELCSIIEEDSQSVYDVLDAIVGILNNSQLNEVEDIIVNQYGED
jgi:hypothetical protein